MFVHGLQPNLYLLDAFYRTLGLDLWLIDTGDPHGDPEDFRRFWNQSLQVLCEDPNRLSLGCRFYMSRGSVPGMAPQCAQEGDVIFIPWGSNMPFVIRRCSEKGDRYQLIGACYQHGVMHGEVFKLVAEGQLRSEDIYLV